jgi:hypothetical protein
MGFWRAVVPHFPDLRLAFLREGEVNRKFFVDSIRLSGKVYRTWGRAGEREVSQGIARQEAERCD